MTTGLQEQYSEAVSPEATHSEKDGAGAILIVEDDQWLRGMLQKRLEGAGFEVICATTGAEAIEMASAGAGLLLLLDYNLPDMTAKQVVTILAQEQHPLPFVVMTGSGDETIAVEMMKLGARDYLVKGNGFMSLLIEVVSRVVAQLHTEQRLEEAEAKLRESQRSLSRLMSNLPGMAYRCQNDRDRTMTFVSQGCAKITGYQPSDFGGNGAVNYVQSIHEDDREMVLSTITSSLNQKRSFELVYRIHSADAEEKWVWEKGSGIFSADGEFQSLEGFIADITDRKRAEEALAKSEEQYKNLYNNALVGMFVTAIDGQRAFAVNDTGLRMFGYASQEEFIRDFVPADHYTDPADREALAQELKCKGQVDKYQCKFTRKDGSKFWAEFYAKAYPEKGWVESVSVDITERKEAEDALRNKEAHYRRLIEKAPDGILVLDGEEIMQYCSASLKRILGYEEEENIGRSLLELVHPDDLPRVSDTFSQLLTVSGTTNSAEMRMRHKDASYRYVEVVGTNYLDDPAVKGIVINLRDITERKQTEEALRESEKRYRLIADSVADVIWTSDLNTMKFTYVSPSILRQQGFTVEESLKRIPQETMPPESWEMCMRILSEELTRELRGERDPSESRVIEVEQYHKDGHVIPTEIEVTFLRDQETGPVGLLGVTRDITERKRIEEMKSDFVSLVSHQLKTPVGILAGCVDIMLSGLAGDLTSKQRSWLVKMQETTSKCNYLISDLLNVSRIERGVVSVDLRPVNLGEIMNMAISDYMGSAERKGLTLNIEETDDAIMVLGDAEKMVEALSNVINNAVKFTDHGSVTVRTTSDDTWGTVEVIDTGRGMSAEALNKLFTKDQILSGSPTPDNSSGLGLYIAREFMALQRGDITASSVEGQGSSFSLHVPLAGK
jgi:PAS domain S-box-containing protein